MGFIVSLNPDDYERAGTIGLLGLLCSLRDAVVSLAEVCDGAVLDDHQGFDKADTGEGHSMAQSARSGRNWSPLMYQRAAEMVIKYHRQLDQELVERVRRLLRAGG